MIKEFLKKSTKKKEGDEENVERRKEEEEKRVGIKRSSIHGKIIYLQIFGVSSPLCGVIQDI
jgi:hypothetical protein